MTSQMLVNGMRRLWVLWLSLGFLIALGVIIQNPWGLSNLSSHPNPVQSYAEAMQRIETLRTREPGEMNPVCQVQFLTHGQKVAQAIILVHGYTTCPQQFRELGQRFYDLGYNVLIAPLPHHGLADRMTDAPALITAEELAAYADETVDIAQGLGERVVMLGISAGGVTTAWAAQNRSDIDLAVVISPAFGIKQIPASVTGAFLNIYRLLPDAIIWWNPELQINTPPPYAYPRYSRHGLAQTVRFGFAAQVAAHHNPPAAKKIVVVLNPNDNAVNNELTWKVVKTWQAHNANLTTYDFEASLNLGHDLIDPTQSDQQIEIVYPKLIELVNQ